MRALILVFCLLACPVAADEVLFLGAAVQQANGLWNQSKTVLTEFQLTPDGAAGLIDHSEYQTSFTADFEVTCKDDTVWFVTDAEVDGKPLPVHSGIAVRPYPEWAEVTFADG